MTKAYTDYKDALEYLRDGYFDRVLSYREMAEILTSYCGHALSKSNVWNAQHRSKKCPKHIRVALFNMSLLNGKTRRYRFFYEVRNEEEYKKIMDHMKANDVDFNTISEWSLALLMLDVLPIGRLVKVG